jgi:hypothetical protein
MAAKRSWRTVPAAERYRLSRAVMGGRAVADPREAANAAAYAVWLLERRTPAPWFERLSDVARIVILGVLAVFAWHDLRFLFAAVVYVAVVLRAMALRRSRVERLTAARDANLRVAAGLGVVDNIDFPAPDTTRPSAWTVRPGFLLVVGAILVLGQLALVLLAHESGTHDKRSGVVRAIDAACQHEHTALQALRGAGLHDQAYRARTIAIEDRLMRDIEAAIPGPERRVGVNRLLGRQSDRIGAMEQLADAARVNDRSRMFATNRAAYDAEQSFLAQAWALGATGCKGT